MSLMKTPLTQWGRLEKKTGQRPIDEKPPKLDKKMWEENPKIIDIIDEKTI